MATSSAARCGVGRLTCSHSDKRHAANDIADDEDRVAVAADFVDVDDVRVVKLGRGAGLAQKLFRLGAVELALARNFDRHRAIELAVAGLPNRAERAAADLLDEIEMCDPRRGFSFRWRRVIVAKKREHAAAGLARNRRQRRIRGHRNRVVALRAADRKLSDRIRQGRQRRIRLAIDQRGGIRENAALIQLPIDLFGAFLMTGAGPNPNSYSSRRGSSPASAARGTPA